MNERRTWITMALDVARSCKAAITAAIAPAKAVEAAQVPTPSVRTQCALAGVSRATVYAQQRAVVVDADAKANDLVLCQLIDGQYTARPFDKLSYMLSISFPWPSGPISCGMPSYSSSSAPASKITP